MKTPEEANEAARKREKELWGAITDYADGSCDHQRVQHFLDLYSTATEVAATIDLRASVESVPNKPKTPVSNFRIPPELKAAAMAKAKERGESLTDVVVRALERYVRSKR